MDTRRILQTRANRKARGARPYTNFYEIHKQCTEAAELVLGNKLPEEISHLVERSAVITTVTAIEVYYRDMLDLIFRYCSPSFFEPRLKALHADKFDIEDMMAVYVQRIHPLEIVSSSQSFQSAEKIDKVFSMFLKKSLWSSFIGLQLRIEDKSQTEMTLGPEILEGLRATFALRHELVHDATMRSFMSDQVLTNLNLAATAVFGSDIVLGPMLIENRDPKLEDEVRRREVLLSRSEGSEMR